jgi:serine/threonine protein kinase/predicted negative regulator of RcsB-dependent stress response
MDFRTRYKYNAKTDLLGRGGFATVYKAEDTLLNRTVALKFFTATTAHDNSLIKEISRAIALDHPNLCRYFDAALLETVNLHGETDSIEVGVMEYIDAGDLKHYFNQHREHLAGLLIDVLTGLVYLHKNGIIHRDLKPQNILIKNSTFGSMAKITDFGISKHIGSLNTNSQLMGTVEYMAPEQFSPLKYGIDGRISTNLDLWSFGLMIYELIVGETLFGSRNGGQSSAEQVMSNILNGDIIEQKIKVLPEPYHTIAGLCLVKEASKRVQNAADLIPYLENAPTPMPKVNQHEASKNIGPDAETVLLDRPKASESMETVVLNPPKTSSSNLETVALNIEPEKKAVPAKPVEETKPVSEIKPEEAKPAAKAESEVNTPKPKAEVKHETPDNKRKPIEPVAKKPENVSESRTRAETLAASAPIYREQTTSEKTVANLAPKKKKGSMVLISVIFAVVLIGSAVVLYGNKQEWFLNDYDYALKHYGDTTTQFLPKLISAANSGNDSAQFKLGSYYVGKGKFKDAITSLQPLAEKKDARALTLLGDSRYELGMKAYNEKNYDTALDLFRSSAADAENAKAQCMIGNLYYWGQGVKQSSSDALHWYLKSADQNNEVANFALGLFYADGIGVERNVREARKYLTWAVKNAKNKQTHNAAKQKLAEL